MEFFSYMRRCKYADFSCSLALFVEKRERGRASFRTRAWPCEPSDSVISSMQPADELPLPSSHCLLAPRRAVCPPSLCPSLSVLTS